MARVKRAVHGRKHHRAILEKAEGYYGNRSRDVQVCRTKRSSTRCSTRTGTGGRARVISAASGYSASTPPHVRTGRVTAGSCRA